MEKYSDVPGPSILGVKWFRYWVSIHHPLGFKDGTPTGRCWYMSAWSATMDGILDPLRKFSGTVHRREMSNKLLG